MRYQHHRHYPADLTICSVAMCVSLDILGLNVRLSNSSAHLVAATLAERPHIDLNVEQHTNIECAASPWHYYSPQNCPSARHSTFALVAASCSAFWNESIGPWEFGI